MKASLQLNQSQRLTMTPQLQQAIKLLQLSSLELQQEIQSMLDNNPMLEESPSGESQQNSERSEQDTASEKPNDETFSESSLDMVENAFSNPEMIETADRDFRDELASDPCQNLDRTDYSSSQNLNNGESDLTQQQAFQKDSADTSLQSHLLDQLNLCTMSKKDTVIAYMIIESLDDRGYLEDSPEELVEELNLLAHQNNTIDIDDPYQLDEFIAVLHRVQNFDPPGIASVNLQDCLSIQLAQLPPDTPYKKEALTLVSNHLHQLNSKEINLVRQRSKISEHSIKEAFRLIKTLNPFPGRSIEDEKTNYITPDIIVRCEHGIWIAELNEDSLPKIHINHHYASLVKVTQNNSDQEFLKSNLQEARWFIKSLRSRHETLLKVAQKIMHVQQDFFNYGPEAMKPLVLHDIADMIDMHESTVSRITTNKYMLSPMGVLELKYFFSSHVESASGGECSSTAIRALIKKLIAAENKQKPLSDSKLCIELASKGITVARRTVAKYRESLSIPSSSNRKQIF